MAETSLARLKALEAYLAALQKARAIGISEAATWRRLREELERIVPRPKRDTEPVRVLTDDLERKCAQTATAMAKERGVWEKLRAEIEAHRLKIRNELEAYRSRKCLPYNGPHSPDKSSSPKRR